MPSVIYQAQITNNTNDEHKKYLGAAETLLKERYSNHIGDFKPKRYMKCTQLSRYIWSLKNEGITPIVKRRTVQINNNKFSPDYCKLCLTEKIFIIKSLKDCNFLNKRLEFVSKWRYQNKLLLYNGKRNDSID